MPETFRLAREEEVPEIGRLVSHSFVGRAPGVLEEAVRAGDYGGWEVLWVGEEDGRPTSACHLLRFHQWVGGARLPMMGLGMVTVSPAHRRRGVAARLVASGLRHARERGDVASALFPFRITFYEGLGYGLAGEALQYMLPPAAFPDAPERRGVALVDSEADRAAVRALYDRWAPLENGQLERHDGHWRRAWEGERAGFLFRGEGGEAEGYMIVRYRSDLPPRDRFLEVEERVWLTPAARRGLLAWLGSLGDQWHTIAYRAHPEEGFADTVREPRLPQGAGHGWGLWFPAATLLVGPMFRLVDPAAAWAARSVLPADPIAVGVELRDEQIPENAGRWTLRLEDGRATMERGEGAADLTLRLAVRDLSRIFVGAVAPSALVAAGAIEAPGAAADRLHRLDAALRIRRPWTYDRF